jgi:SHOCT-like protein
MQYGNTWELPFGQPAKLELQTEWGTLALVPVEPGQTPRLELTPGSSEHIAVHVGKVGDTVRVALDPQRSFSWFGSWECGATLYVPRDVHAHVQTNAGSVSVRDLEDCELGIKASAGKIDLVKVHGLVHLSADAGSVTGRDVGGYFDVETHAGSIRLEISDLRPGEHRIRASMGSVRIELARGIDVSVETRTSLGSVRNRFPSRHSAAAKLLLSTEMGSLRVDEGSSTFRPAGRSTAPYAPFQPERPERPEQPEPATPTTPKPPREDPELDRILKMVEAGELSANDADELLRAMGRV